MTHLRFAGVFLLVSPFLVGVASPARAQGSGQPAAPAAPAHVLPLLQDKIPEAYREHVPLPFGVSFTYFRVNERLALTEPSLAFSGQPVPAMLIQADSLAAVTNSYTARFDAWVFPFLNVYGTATKFSGTASDIRASVALPLPPGAPPVIPQSVDYDGKGFGVGFTLAFGYRWLFASYNFARSWQFLELMDNTERVTVQGPRVGLQLRPFGIEGNVYIGAMHEYYAGRQKGSLAVPGLGALAFDLVAEPTHGWNPTLGAEIGFTRHIRANIEAGFRGRTHVLLGGGYRF
jgi:hypothetical protein